MKPTPATLLRLGVIVMMGVLAAILFIYPRLFPAPPIDATPPSAQAEGFQDLKPVMEAWKADHPAAPVDTDTDEKASDTPK